MTALRREERTRSSQFIPWQLVQSWASWIWCWGLSPHSSVKWNRWVTWTLGSLLTLKFSDSTKWRWHKEEMREFHLQPFECNCRPCLNASSNLFLPKVTRGKNTDISAHPFLALKGFQIASNFKPLSGGQRGACGQLDDKSFSTHNSSPHLSVRNVSTSSFLLQSCQSGACHQHLIHYKNI